MAHGGRFGSSHGFAAYLDIGCRKAERERRGDVVSVSRAWYAVAVTDMMCHSPLHSSHAIHQGDLTVKWWRADRSGRVWQVCLPCWNERQPGQAVMGPEPQAPGQAGV